MIRVFIIIATIFSTPILQSQTITRSCSYYGDSAEHHEDICSSLGYSSNEEAEAAIDKILEQIGIFNRNFGVLECGGIDNCMAYRKGELQYIIYDREFLEKFKGLGFKNVDLTENWAAISIMAHEIGHLQNQHLMVTNISNHKHELEADVFSGFVLAKLGASLKQAQAAMHSHVVSEKGSYTHPPKQDRLAAIKKGWLKGGGGGVVDTGDKEEEKRPPLKPNKIKNSLFNEKYTGNIAIVDIENKSGISNTLSDLLGNEQFEATTSFFRPDFFKTYGTDFWQNGLEILTEISTPSNLKCVCIVKEQTKYETRERFGHEFTSAKGEIELKIFNVVNEEVTTLRIPVGGSGADNRRAYESFQSNFIKELKINKYLQKFEPCKK